MDERMSGCWRRRPTSWHGLRPLLGAPAASEGAKHSSPRSRLRARHPDCDSSAHANGRLLLSAALPPPRVTLAYAPSGAASSPFPAAGCPRRSSCQRAALKLKVKEKGDEIKSLTADTSDGAPLTARPHANDTQKLLVAEYDRSTGAVAAAGALLDDGVDPHADGGARAAGGPRRGQRSEAGDGYLAALVNGLGREGEEAAARRRGARAPTPSTTRRGSPAT